MGSKSNTWCKKLMTKGKAYAMKEKLGNERGVMSYCMRAKPRTASALNRDTDKDKPQSRPPVTPKSNKLPIPRVADWKPEPFVPTRQNRYWDVRR